MSDSRSLQELAKEYLANVSVMEQRIAEIEREIAKGGSPFVIHRLRERRNVLQRLVNKDRLTAFKMEHYYDEETE